MFSSDKSTSTDDLQARTRQIVSDDTLLFADNPHVQMDKIGALFRTSKQCEDGDTSATATDTARPTTTATTTPNELRDLLDQASLLVGQVQNIGVKGRKRKL